MNIDIKIAERRLIINHNISHNIVSYSSSQSLAFYLGKLTNKFAQSPWTWLSQGLSKYLYRPWAQPIKRSIVSDQKCSFTQINSLVFT